ncbi:MAG: aminoglycoside phosphotransferase family protein [Acidimicrobiales bacterium]
MPAAEMPAAEVEITPALVRALLTEQCPDLAVLGLEPLAFGWDNVSYRLGDELVVRLPRRALAARLVEHEQRWLPTVADRVPLPVPAPVVAGRPGSGYPWAWSVVPYLPGHPAAIAPPPDPGAAAVALGRFVTALHRCPADGLPANPYRGGLLADRDEAVRDRLARLADDVDAPAVVARWEQALGAPVHVGPPVFLHGDLHPANLLVAEGRLSAVIDFGDLTAGDPATDLAAGWMLFDERTRGAFRGAAGDPDDATWDRARGWALNHALACLATSADNPVMHGVGERTLANVLADPA